VAIRGIRIEVQVAEPGSIADIEAGRLSLNFPEDI
jgi:hypothetical protein